MIIVQPRRIADQLVTATGAPTGLYVLADTASLGTQSRPAASYYGNVPSGPGQGCAVNCVYLRPSTVDIRVSITINPTAVRGTLIPAGSTFAIACDPSLLKVISTGVDTTVDVTYCILAPGEAPASLDSSSTAIGVFQEAAAVTSANSTFAAGAVVASALAANANRSYANIRNSGAKSVRVSSDPAMIFADGNGALITAGDNVNWPTVEEVFAICNAGDATTLDIIDFSN